MGLSTERKVFLGLFLVAGGALVFDQAFLGPGSASADMLTSSIGLNDESTAAVITPVNTSTGITAASLLNERLAGLDTRSNANGASLDALFGHLEMVAPEIGSPISDEAGSQQRIIPNSISLPKLTAVMPASSGGAAVINGQLIRAGQTTAGGFRLITVQQRSVVLEKDGKSYSIAVPVNGS